MMSETTKLPSSLLKFVNNEEWTFAKTMPEWPHEYLVRDRVDDKLFEALVRHIRRHGFQGRFYERTLTYFAEDGLLYWTMGAPVEQTTIINRCKAEGSYENRLRNGNLPPAKFSKWLNFQTKWLSLAGIDCDFAEKPKI